MSRPEAPFTRPLSASRLSGPPQLDADGHLPPLGLHRERGLSVAHPAGAVPKLWPDPQSAARFSPSVPALCATAAVPGRLAVSDRGHGVWSVVEPAA